MSVFTTCCLLWGAAVPPGDDGFILPPWEQYPRSVGYVPLVALLLLLLYALVERFYLSPRRRAEAAKERRGHMHNIAVERQLSEEEEEVLVEVIQERHTASPMAALASQSYFESFVRERLVQRLGEASANRVEEKLFPHLQAVEPEGTELSSTRNLGVGQSLRLHFSGRPAEVPAVVISVSEHNFVATFSPSAPRIRFADGARVRAFLTHQNARYIFETRIEDMYTGEVVACTLTHSDEVRRVHRRGKERVDLSEPIVFSFLGGKRSAAGQLNVEELANVFQEKSKGQLRDLSLGGCSLIASDRVKIAVGDLVRFKLELFMDIDTVPALGSVVDITRQRVEEGPEAGSSTAEAAERQVLHIQFCGLSEQDLDSLALCFERLLKEKRKREELERRRQQVQ